MGRERALGGLACLVFGRSGRGCRGERSDARAVSRTSSPRRWAIDSFWTPSQRSRVRARPGYASLSPAGTNYSVRAWRSTKKTNLRVRCVCFLRAAVSSRDSGAHWRSGRDFNSLLMRTPDPTSRAVPISSKPLIPAAEKARVREAGWPLVSNARTPARRPALPPRTSERLRIGSSEFRSRSRFREHCGYTREPCRDHGPSGRTTDCMDASVAGVGRPRAC